MLNLVEFIKKIMNLSEFIWVEFIWKDDEFSWVNLKDDEFT